MPWFKVDDGFHGHPKVVELSLAAVGLWTLAGSWSAKYLTDGAISARTVQRLGGSVEDATELVDVDLWSAELDGWQFKDWADYQPLKDQVEAERSAAQERMRRVRAKKKGVQENADESSADVQPNGDGTAADVRVTPSQSQSQSQSLPEEKRGAAKRGTRIPEPFIVNAVMREWAAGRVPGVDVDSSTEKFVNYWRAKTAQATKLDWRATWDNWLISDFEKIQSRGQHPKPTTKADQNAAAYYEIYGGDGDGGTGSISALDVGISAR